MFKSNYRLSIAVTLFIVTLLFSSCGHPEFTSGEISRFRSRANDVTIYRDNYGIAHVYGKSDADAVFGMIYAQCEDDFNRVEVNYITALGRMAEVEGEGRIYHDLRMKMYIDPEVLRQEYSDSPRWLKDLMDAWSDGINYYLYSNPDVEPKLLTRFEPWMALAFTEGSIGGDIERISPQQLRAFYGDGIVEEEEEADYGNGDGIGYDEKDLTGSNGFALAPSMTKAGNAMLLINPHTSFYFRPEIHMVSEEGLNAYGAVTWGQFFIYQGFNERAGWMHTSIRPAAINYFNITVVEEEGEKFYKFGDELRPFTTKEITIPYRDGDKLSERVFTAYYTHHGPIIRQQGDHWVAINIMVEREKALTQSYLRTKAMNYDEFHKTMQMKTNSSNGTVYADADGNIAYYHGNYVPRRDPSFNWSRPVDGSNPATEFDGLHEPEEMILIKNPPNGWVQNCNSDPFTAAGEHSPRREDFPAYIAFDRENARGLNAIRILSSRRDFTLDKLIEAAYDPYLIGFENVIPNLVRSYDRLSRNDRELREKLAGPIEALRNWDLNASVESVPTSLAIFYSQSLRGQRNDERREVNALIAAVDRLTEDFGTWETPWGEINRFQRLTGDISHYFSDDEPSLAVGFPGSHGSLAVFGASRFRGSKRMYGTRGNSFVAVVEFGERIKARSILAGGVSGDPDSPHFFDQAEMYARGEFKDVLFYKEDVVENAIRSYSPGQ